MKLQISKTTMLTWRRWYTNDIMFPPLNDTHCNVDFAKANTLALATSPLEAHYMLGGRVGIKGGIILGSVSKEHGVQYNLELMDLILDSILDLSLHIGFSNLETYFLQQRPMKFDATLAPLHSFTP